MKLPKPLGETLGEVLLGGAMTVLATQAGWAAPLASTPANPASSPSEDVATTLEASAEAPEESLTVEQQKTAGKVSQKSSQKSSQNSSAQTSETREPASALEVAQAQPGSFSQLPTPPAFSAPAPMAPSPGAPQPVTPPASVLPPPAPDVLVPNPNVTIDGVPAAPAGAIQPVSPAPPFLPRAVAPPVGDIAVSNINANPGGIDLGTGQRVSRLLLRDTSSREVLAILARQAGLNLVFIGGAAPGAQGAPGGAPGAAGGEQDTSPRISLDIENEPVQEVFNYVLRVAGLEANRVGTTIFVGTRLPDEARNVIVRSLRMNQVPVTSAANFLTAQGAETQIPTEQVQIQTIGEGAAARTVETRTPSILALRANEGNGPLLLRGISILTDERLNAITLVGPPRKVEIAVGMLMQLDARRRQVAVNVRVVDVNLVGIDNFNSSFSFGVADSFFSVDGGNANVNYGTVRPPTAAQIQGSVVSTPVIANPYAGANIFLDPRNNFAVQNTAPATLLVDPALGGVNTIEPRGSAFFPNSSIVLNDPLTPGITGITPATDNIITVTRNPGTPPTTTVTQGTLGTITQSLPTLFQFPRRFLASLQAQIQSGNAKILTDPTLIVQEGQTAAINLTQEVFGGTQTEFVAVGNTTVPTTRPIIKQAGLSLGINVARIDDNGFVTLAVNPRVSAIGGSQNTPQGVITLLQDRSLTSGQVRMRDGQTLILAGIIQESDRTTVSKVPILGDIPLLGALFRSTNRQNQRQEVIVLVTPQIMDDSARSTFGYSYTPSPQTRDVLQRGGFSVPR